MAIRELDPLAYQTSIDPTVARAQLEAIKQQLSELKMSFGIQPGGKKTQAYKDAAAPLAVRQRMLEESLRGEGVEPNVVQLMPGSPEFGKLAANQQEAVIQGRKRILDQLTHRLADHRRDPSKVLSRAELREVRTTVTQLNGQQRFDLNTAYSSLAYRMHPKGL